MKLIWKENWTTTETLKRCVNSASNHSVASHFWKDSHYHQCFRLGIRLCMWKSLWVAAFTASLPWISSKSSFFLIICSHHSGYTRRAFRFVVGLMSRRTAFHTPLLSSPGTTCELYAQRNGPVGPKAFTMAGYRHSPVWCATPTEEPVFEVFFIF